MSAMSIDIVSIEPKQGSPAGGTLIIITGKHFTDPLGDIKVDISGMRYTPTRRH